MNTLQEIIRYKRLEIAYNQKVKPEDELRQMIDFDAPKRSLKERLLNRIAPTSVIAEFKRSSPSKPHLHPHADIKAIVSQYALAPLAGISVLTDERFFGGSIFDLRDARKLVDIPILRKDFILDPYQIVEAKAFGADVILLIAACLSKSEIAELTSFAHDLELEVLCEIHQEEELEKLNSAIDIIGINNRNLATFETSIEQSLSLFEKLPKGPALISESGIKSAQDAASLLSRGFHGLLIGESFMNDENPGARCNSFCTEVHQIVNAQHAG